MLQIKKNCRNKNETLPFFYIRFLGLTGHVYSNFPFVTSVGDRCFEEKHVFIASKALENAACKYNKMIDASMIFFLTEFNCCAFSFNHFKFIFFSTRYKCHKECVPNAPPNCGFSEMKLRRAIDNTDIQNALGKRVYIIFYLSITFIFLANSSPLSRKYPFPRKYFSYFCTKNFL